MSNPTTTYLNLALLGKNRWWRYLLGVILIIVSSIGLILGLVTAVGQLKKFGILPAAVADHFMGIALGIVADQSVLAFVILNLSILGMLIGLYIAMWLLHRRPTISLVSPAGHIDWRRIFAAAIVGFILLATISLVEALLFPGRYRFTFDATRFFPFMIAALLLTPFQAATEELIFRGYVMQGLGVITRNAWVIAILSSLLFAAVHLWNPEVARYGFWSMALAYFLSGLMFASIALRDGRLELAIGLHAINNLFSGLIANSDSSVLQTNSIFTSALDPTFSIVGLIITTVAFHWWFFDRAAAKARRAKEVEQGAPSILPEAPASATSGS